jgi:hypothetical protein
MHSVAKRSALMFVLVASCTSGSDTRPRDSTATRPLTPTVAPRRDSAVTALTFDTTRWTADVEARAIAASAGRVTRDGPLLEIRVPGRRPITLRDQQPDTVGEQHPLYVEKDRYIYLGELGVPGYGVIGVASLQFSEPRLLLLNEQTGDTTEIAGVPVPSPNRKRFLVTQHEINRERNSVEIWSVDSGAARVEWGTGDDELQPIDGHWKDDSTITYRMVPMQPGASVDTIRMLLPFRDGEWKMPTRVTP